MVNLNDATATELADDLEVMRHHRHNTGGLSQLDEATMAFGGLSPELHEVQRAFSAARHAHIDSYRAGGAYSDEAWDVAMDAANRLATELRKLGDHRVARCKENTGWGVCNLPLDSTGACRAIREHR